MSRLHDLAARALHVLAPESAHAAALAALKIGLGPKAEAADPRLAVQLAGLDLPNCIGLAAGFDKDAEAPAAMLAAGFGFVECGAVTPLPQDGNPRPRLFRLSADRGVINRMGFNNRGLDAFAERLRTRRRNGVVGVNVGANKDSEDRIGDYVTVLRRLWTDADYFTVNVSSPNTPGLRSLQSAQALDDLLGRIAAARTGLPGARPIFLKVAPDVEDRDVEAITEAAVRHGLAGLIVGNTTLSRPASLRSPHRRQAGGLSGAPLRDLSTAVLRRFAEAAAGRLVLIGAGGVASGADAYAKIRAGAAAVQLYSALVYAGPGLVVRIQADLAARLAADGFASVAEAVGAR